MRETTANLLLVDVLAQCGRLDIAKARAREMFVDEQAANRERLRREHEARTAAVEARS